jgi:hypothetical protein
MAEPAVNETARGPRALAEPTVPVRARWTAGSYPTLFASTAIAATIGSVLVWRIKSVP